MLSTIILTHNNQKTIEKCLESIQFSDEIIIIDDFSGDQTLDKIKNLSSRPQWRDLIKIFQHKLNNDFSSQRNFGLKKAKGDWILFLDSDEYLSQSLQKEIKCHCENFEKIRGNLQENNFNLKLVNGFYIPRQTKFLGRILKYGETGNTKILRLAKANSEVWQGKVHETWNIKGKTETFKNPIIHDQQLSISEFITKINNYSNIKAQELFEKKVEEPLIYIFIYPISKFILNYFLKLGFLDGFVGFALAYIMSFHSLLVRLKLQLLHKKSVISNEIKCS